MRLRVSKILLSTLFFLFCVSGNLSAQEVSLTIKATTDKNEVALDEHFNYNVVISSSESLINPKIKLPDLEKDFIVLSSGRSQNVLFSGGRTEIQIILNYALRPNKEGEFKIGPLELTYRGKTYKSENVSLKVTSSKSAAPAAPEEEMEELAPGEKVTL